jgi:hypothetical protein
MYNAFQAHIAKRFSHGVTGQFSYTFSKDLGDRSYGGGYGGSGVYGYRDPRDLALSKGILNIDRPELFQWNVLYELPIGKNRALLGQTPRLVDAIAGGWQVSSFFVWQSGVPLTFTNGSSTTAVYTYS